MTSRYVNVTPLPDALRSWSGKPLDAIPADTAPPGYLPGCDGENRLLADVFARLTALDTTTDRLSFLASAVIAHDRRLKLAWDSARGRADTTRSFDATDRSAMVRLRPYEAMIDALKLWLDDLHEAAAAEIGVRFIDEAARRTA